MTSDIEIAIVGAIEMAMHVERWYRLRRRRVTVSRYHVEQWIKLHGFPATRVGRGRWTAAPSEVCAWCDAHLSATMNLQSSQVSQNASLTRTD